MSLTLRDLVIAVCQHDLRNYREPVRAFRCRKCDGVFCLRQNGCPKCGTRNVPKYEDRTEVRSGVKVITPTLIGYELVAGATSSEKHVAMRGDPVVWISADDAEEMEKNPTHTPVILGDKDSPILGPPFRPLSILTGKLKEICERRTISGQYIPDELKDTSGSAADDWTKRLEILLRQFMLDAEFKERFVEDGIEPCGQLDLTGAWLDTLHDEGLTSEILRRLQTRFPAVAAEMGLETLVQAAPTAGGETPATVANMAGTQPPDELPPAFVDEATKQQIAIVTAIVKRSDRMRIRELEGMPGCFRNPTNTAETIVRALNRTNENLVPSCNWELKWHSEVDRTDAEVWIIRPRQK